MKKMKKRLGLSIICVVALLVLVFLIITTTRRSYEAELQRNFVDYTTFLLSTSQTELSEAISNDDREILKSLALRYSLMGGSYQIISRYVTNAYHYDGGWGNVASVVLNISLKDDASFSVSERTCLLELYELNESLLLSLSSEQHLSKEQLGDLLLDYRLKAEKIEVVD